MCFAKWRPHPKLIIRCSVSKRLWRALLCSAFALVCVCFTKNCKTAYSASMRSAMSPTFAMHCNTLFLKSRHASTLMLAMFSVALLRSSKAVPNSLMASEGWRSRESICDGDIFATTAAMRHFTLRGAVWALSKSAMRVSMLALSCMTVNGVSRFVTSCTGARAGAEDLGFDLERQSMDMGAASSPSSSSLSLCLHFREEWGQNFGMIFWRFGFGVRLLLLWLASKSSGTSRPRRM